MSDNNSNINSETYQSSHTAEQFETAIGNIYGLTLHEWTFIMLDGKEIKGKVLSE